MRTDCVADKQPFNIAQEQSSVWLAMQLPCERPLVFLDREQPAEDEHTGAGIQGRQSNEMFPTLASAGRIGHAYLYETGGFLTGWARPYLF